MKRTLLQLGFVVLGTAALVACSSSNNLSDPSSKTGETVTSCTGQANCVTGQFIDEVVSNLDYSCESVRSVTGSDGTFTCVEGSKVTFFLGHPTTARRLILGEMTMPKKVVNQDSSGAVNSRGVVVRISPMDIVVSGSMNSPQVQNLVRFLKAVDSDGSATSVDKVWDDADYNASLPNNKIVVGDNIRLLVTKLSTDIQASEFNVNNDFSAAITAFLTEVGKNGFGAAKGTLNSPVSSFVPSQATAIGQFDTFLRTTTVGVYYGAASSCILGRDLSIFNRVAYDLGMCSEGTGAKKNAADMLLLVDRSGYGVGVGLTYTFKVAANASGRLLATPEEHYFDTNSTARPIDYISRALTLRTSEVAGKGADDFVFDWRGNFRSEIIASTDDDYKAFFGSAPTNASDLGVWTMTVGTAAPRGTGKFHFNNIKPASANLDDATFKYDGTGAEALFQQKFPNGQVVPRSLRLQFKVHTANTCSDDTTNPAAYYCTDYANVPISILPSGNIVTNLNADSGDCNRFASEATLLDSASTPQQEYRIGFIGSVRENNTLSMNLLFPRSPAIQAAVGKDLAGVTAGVFISVSVPAANNTRQSVDGNVLLPVLGTNRFKIAAADARYWMNYLVVYQNSTTPDEKSSNTADSGLLLVDPIECVSPS